MYIRIMPVQKEGTAIPICETMEIEIPGSLSPYLALKIPSGTPIITIKTMEINASESVTGNLSKISSETGLEYLID
jgi:hypothetical protein